MKKLFSLFSLLVLVHSSIYCQQTTKSTDSIVVQPTDVESINSIIAALYNVISGPAGEVRNWNRMRTLFLPEAKMVATGVRPSGEIVKRVMTVEDYISQNGPVLEKNGFFETEIHRKQEVYGHIAHCFSTYEARKTATDAQPFMRGINSIQLYHDGKRWWVLSIFWQSENKELPLPKEYLPQ